jgi:hypothetical protein
LWRPARPFLWEVGQCSDDKPICGRRVGTEMGTLKEMGKHGSRVDIWMKYSVGTQHEGFLRGLPHLLELYAFTNLIFDRVSITRF